MYVASLFEDNNKTYSWKFTTGEVPTIPIQEQIENQSRSDQNYGDYVKSINDNFPWYNKLPIQTNAYFVYFSTDQKRFIGNIYYPKGSSQPTDQKVQLQKDEVISRLRTLGIPVDTYPFTWSVQEK